MLDSHSTNLYFQLVKNWSNEPGVVERVDVVTSVPDPNPALLGRTSERNVNMRGGPGVAFPQVGRFGAGIQLDLLGRYEDWLNVRTRDGTTGWVSRELVNVEDFIARRVPLVRDIPALPRPNPVARRQGTTNPGTAPSLTAPGANAGSVIDFATQFVGASYV